MNRTKPAEASEKYVFILLQSEFVRSIMQHSLNVKSLKSYPPTTTEAHEHEFTTSYFSFIQTGENDLSLSFNIL